MITTQKLKSQSWVPSTRIQLQTIPSYYYDTVIAPKKQMFNCFILFPILIPEHYQYGFHLHTTSGRFFSPKDFARDSSKSSGGFIPGLKRNPPGVASWIEDMAVSETGITIKYNCLKSGENEIKWSSRPWDLREGPYFQTNTYDDTWNYNKRAKTHTNLHRVEGCEVRKKRA